MLSQYVDEVIGGELAAPIGIHDLRDAISPDRLLQRISPAVAVRLGDVKLTVISDQAGAIGVHGLSAIEAIHPGKSVTIQFRAIYSGRLPLHFHGIDGSHFELTAINATADAHARAHN